MRNLLLLLLIASCAGDDQGGGPVTPTPDACTEADTCDEAKDLATAECGVLYACDPTYQEGTSTCYAAELEKLCVSGDAARLCATPSCQIKNNYRQCRAEQATCDDPAVCIPAHGAECTP